MIVEGSEIHLGSRSYYSMYHINKDAYAFFYIETFQCRLGVKIRDASYMECLPQKRLSIERN